jgi:hypothetical protein
MVTAPCPVCDFVLDKYEPEYGEPANVPSDIRDLVTKSRRAHRRFHAKFVAASAGLPFRPAPKVLRDRVKERGEELLWPANPLKQRLLGAKLKLYALFHKSLRAAVEGGYHGQHLSRAQFIGMVDLERLFGPSVASQLRCRYGRSTAAGFDPRSGMWKP